MLIKVHKTPDCSTYSAIQMAGRHVRNSNCSLAGRHVRNSNCSLSLRCWQRFETLHDLVLNSEQYLQEQLSFLNTFRAMY